jgi:hypothetical protein
MQSTCEQCGAAPAVLVTSRRHLGLVVYGRTTRTQRVLCRAHARALTSGDLVSTLFLGWWGVFSFFINLGVVAGQFSAMSKASAIPAPQRLAT